MRGVFQVGSWIVIFMSSFALLVGILYIVEAFFSDSLFSGFQLIWGMAAVFNSALCLTIVSWLRLRLDSPLQFPSTDRAPSISRWPTKSVTAPRTEPKDWYEAMGGQR
jgi:hypothetical protein